jgi:uncharacterized membrane protein (UPF0127 family)
MIRNLSRDTVLAEQPRLAASMLWRMRGMIGREFDGFDALVFRRCGSIHTWLMGMSIDVIFVDTDDCVCGIRHELQPWRLAGERRGRTVIELPAGSLAETDIELNDQLEIAV